MVRSRWAWVATCRLANSSSGSEDPTTWRADVSTTVMEDCGTPKPEMFRPPTAVLENCWIHAAGDVQVYACLDGCHGVHGKELLRRHHEGHCWSRCHVLTHRCKSYVLECGAGAAFSRSWSDGLTTGVGAIQRAEWNGLCAYSACSST